VAPREYRKGYLTLSLVSCPIYLFPATSSREKISSISSTSLPATHQISHIGLEMRGNGIMGVTLRYPCEVRRPDEHFWRNRGPECAERHAKGKILANAFRNLDENDG
jgi:non-homologous end joining protein Ku